MSKFYDANYNITKIRTENGDIAELELNNKEVSIGGGSSVDIDTWYIWSKSKSLTDPSTYIILPFNDATTITSLSNFEAQKLGYQLSTGSKNFTIVDVPDYSLFNNLSAFTDVSATKFTVTNNGTTSTWYLSSHTDLATISTDYSETIDVAQYTAPVTFDFTRSGADGSKSVTVTLQNIPSGGSSNTIFGDLNDNSVGGSSIQDSTAQGSWFHALVFDSYAIENPDTHETATINGIYLPEKYATINTGGGTSSVTTLSLTSTQETYLLTQINNKLGTSFTSSDIGTTIPLMESKVNALCFCMFNADYIPYLFSTIKSSGVAYAVFVYNSSLSLSNSNANTFAMSIMNTF